MADTSFLTAERSEWVTWVDTSFFDRERSERPRKKTWVVAWVATSFLTANRANFANGRLGLLVHFGTTQNTEYTEVFPGEACPPWIFNFEFQISNFLTPLWVFGYFVIPRAWVAEGQECPSSLGRRPLDHRRAVPIMPGYL
jgi:hypothetical protein